LAEAPNKQLLLIIVLYTLWTRKKGPAIIWKKTFDKYCIDFHYSWRAFHTSEKPLNISQLLAQMSKRERILQGTVQSWWGKQTNWRPRKRTTTIERRDQMSVDEICSVKSTRSRWYYYSYQTSHTVSGKMPLNKLHNICVEVWESGYWKNGHNQSSSFYPRKVTCFRAATTGSLYWSHMPATSYWEWSSIEWSQSLKEKLLKNRLDFGQKEACVIISQILISKCSRKREKGINRCISAS